jgi:hypothetical protein
MEIDLETGIPERHLYPKSFQFGAPLVLIVVGGVLDALLSWPKLGGIGIEMIPFLLLVVGMLFSFGLRAILGALVGGLLLKYAILIPLELGAWRETELTDPAGRVIAVYDGAISQEEAIRRYKSGDYGKDKDQ